MTSMEKILLVEDSTSAPPPDGVDGPISPASEEVFKNREIAFLAAAEVGDIRTVSFIILSQPDFNVDCVDALGRTALRLAVKNEHTEVVGYLLDRCSLYNMYESLLVSIRYDTNYISEAIIRHPRYEELRDAQAEAGSSGGHDGSGGSGSGFDFQHVDDTLSSLDVTPLMLAAQRNQYEIVHLLLKMGEEIPDPHDVTCACDACISVGGDDGLRHARARLNAYRSLCSPAYITLSSRQFQTDPILYSFHLHRTLQKVANSEKHYRAEYLQLAAALGDFETTLIDRVRNDQELEILLNHQEGAMADAFTRMARLKLAIYYDRKKFVAHAYCQKKLISEWYGSLFEYRARPFWWSLAWFFILLVAYPFLAILYLIMPWSKIGRFLRVPIIKFLGHTYVNIMFVVLIITHSITEKATAFELLSNTTEIGQAYTTYVDQTLAMGDQPVIADVYVRYHGAQIATIAMVLTVLGYVLQECTELFRLQLTYYYDSLFNLLDFLFQALYVASFTLRYLAITKVHLALTYFSVTNSWTLLHQGDATARYHAYWLTADRYYWDYGDPLVLSEALFAVATVISMSRVGTFLIVSERVGPMLISLYRMLVDFSRFMVLFLIFILAFIIGFLNLYWYYSDDIRLRVETIAHPDLVVNAAGQLDSFLNIAKTVYWAMFGMSEVESVEIGQYQFEAVTSGTGYLLFMIYNWITIIILINMLIAMMSRSYEIITEDQDVEWKFNRSKIYMDYIGHLGTLPPPFNLLPSVKTIINCAKSTISCCCSCRRSGQHKLDDASRSKDGSIMLTDVDQNTKSPAEKKAELSADASVSYKAGMTNGSKVKIQLDRASLNDSSTDLKPGQPAAGSNGTAPVEDATSKSGSGGAETDDDQMTMSEFSILDVGPYDQVMHDIIRRYLVLGQRTSEVSNDTRTEDNSGVDSIQKDLSSLRYELTQLIREQASHVLSVERDVEQMRSQMCEIVGKCEAILEAQSKQPTSATVYTPSAGFREKIAPKKHSEEAPSRRKSPLPSASSDRLSSLPSRRNLERSDDQLTTDDLPSPTVKQRLADNKRRAGDAQNNKQPTPSGGANRPNHIAPSSGGQSTSSLNGTPLDNLFDNLSGPAAGAGAQRTTTRSPSPMPMHEKSGPTIKETFETVGPNKNVTTETGVGPDGRRYKKTSVVTTSRFGNGASGFTFPNLDYEMPFGGQIGRLGSFNGPHNHYSTISSFGIGSDYTPMSVQSRKRNFSTRAHKKL